MKTNLILKASLAAVFLRKKSYAFDLQDAFENALIEKKLLLIGVQSKNCIYCKKMEKEIFESKRVMYKLNKWYVYRKIMIEKDKLPDLFEVEYFPTHFVVDPIEKSIIEKFIGFIEPRDFVNYLKVIYNQEESKLRPKIDMM